MDGLKQKIKDSVYNQHEVATLLGMNRSMLSRIVNGRKDLPADKEEKLEEILSKSYKMDIMDLSDKENKYEFDTDRLLRSLIRSLKEEDKKKVVMFISELIS